MSSPRNDLHAKWRKFVQDIKGKRTRKTVNTSGKQKINKSSNSFTNKKEITLQLFASEATGKAQKLEQNIPQEFVAFPSENVTISNIVVACNMQFQGRLLGLTCDLQLESMDQVVAEWASFQISRLSTSDFYIERRRVLSI